MNEKTLYTLIRNEHGELHLFKSYKSNDNCFPLEKKSICKKMDYRRESNFMCESEDEARIKCAKIGEDVCGTCVSHLYADYR